MKIISIVTFICVLLATTAYASWQDDFPTTYQDKGIEQAVEDALAEGGSLEAIFAEAQKITGVDIQALIVALHCAGVNTNDIKNAATAAGIPSSQVAAAQKQGRDTCPRFNGIPGSGASSRGNNPSDPGVPTPPPVPPVPKPPTAKPPVPPPSSPATF